MRRRLPCLLLVGSLLVGSLVRASPSHTIWMFVTGAGKPVRVQVELSPERLCSFDRPGGPWLDAWYGPGAQIPLTFPTDCICYRYTHGYFRQTDFTLPRRECAARHGRELHPVPPIVIVAD